MHRHRSVRQDGRFRSGPCHCKKFRDKEAESSPLDALQLPPGHFSMMLQSLCGRETEKELPTLASTHGPTNGARLLFGGVPDHSALTMYKSLAPLTEKTLKERGNFDYGLAKV
ncbi:hypothetical protein NDU88_003414 [Pleurodeles waltl]|uniref:Uncharacterized protein n=1 Tax=Pleurodeles waltl TaxID=8319 RepID=A0AAV7MQH3_PLEWA|nr:hypothetical protein NDU88_003414 [Pleurodeles waltl]